MHDFELAQPLKPYVLSLLAAALLLPAPVAAAKPDGLCAPLSAFLAAVGPDEERHFEFHTSWGSDFKDSTEPALAARRCYHHGHEPADAVCAFLMEHGMVEHFSYNLQRVLMCLSRRTRLDPKLSFEHAAISISYGTPERGARVHVELAEDTRLGGMVLKVRASGY